MEVGDAAPSFLIALGFAAGAQWLVARSVHAAGAESWLARSVPGAALVGAILPGCSMATIPLALPLKRHGAGSGSLLAFVITSVLLGPASIVITFSMFGPGWGICRVALPLIAVCLLGWVVNRIGGKPLLPENDLPPFEAPCCGSCEDDSLLGDERSFRRDLLGMIRNLVPLLFLGQLAAAVVSVLIGQERIENWMGGGTFAYAAALLAGIPAYVCEGGEVPLTAALLKMGVGAGPAFTFTQASVGTYLPTIMLLPKVIDGKLTAIYPAFWLVYSVASGLIVGHFL